MRLLLSRGAAVLAVLLIGGIYGCDAGHGFVKDDFGWILTSRLQHLSDLRTLAGAPTGFFRPLVSLSFTIDYALFGVAPRGYGLTNLALLLACIGMLVLLFRATGLRPAVAMAAAVVWGLNFHGINMAVLWISGRTALIVTFWCVAAAWAWIRGHRLWAALFATAAMWSKEEGFVIAPVLTLWAIIDRLPLPGGFTRQIGRIVRDTWMLWAVTAISFIVRVQSGAFTPGSAPPLYRYQLSLTTLAGNIIQYADRSATTPLVALLLFWIAAGLPLTRQRRHFSNGARTPPPALSYAAATFPREDAWPQALRNVSRGLVWLVLGFTPTIFLPVRSSLYALLPSVGVVLIAGAFADRIVERATPRALERATAVLLIVFVALFPVYKLRNQRYVSEAELSAAVVGEISRIAAAAPAGGLILIKDVRDQRPTAEQAFGPLADRMAELATGGKFQVWIDPPPGELSGVTAPDLSTVAVTLVVQQGSVRRE